MVSKLRPLLLISSVSLVLVGCGIGPTAAPTAVKGSAIYGRVFGGQNPISGARIYMMAANTTGYGAASLPLLNVASTGHSDGTGAYVLTDTGGYFDITGDYSCTPNTQVYLLALGGNTGSGANSASALMAVLGNCPVGGDFSTSIPHVLMNEITTIAAAYAIAGFATDATHVSSSGTAQALVGIANAFANAGNLVNLAQGTALTTTPAGNGTVPQTRLISMGNILASCINSTGAVTGPTNPSACYTLFNNTKNLGASPVTTPTETVSAAINLAHFPGTASTSGVTALYGLISGTPAFSGGLTKAPKDFVIGITFTGDSTIGTYGIAIDASGNAWLANSTSVSELSPLGAVLSGANGFGSGTVQAVESIALDPVNGNIWTGDAGGGIELFSNTGALQAGSPFSGPNDSTGGSSGEYITVAVDLSSNVWVGNAISNTVAEFNSAGTLLHTPTTPSGGGAYIILPLANGNAWAVGENYLSLISSAGVDITPSSLATNSDLGAPSTGVVDASGNVWLTQMGYFVEAGPDGSELSPAAGYPGGGNDTSTTSPTLSIDGDGTLWQANPYKNTLTAFSTTRKAAISTSSGFGSGTISIPEGVALDPSGNAWIATQKSINGYPYFTEGVTELIGIAAPTVTPTNPAYYGVRP